MRRPAVVGEWPDAGVTFDVQRGSFEIPAEVMQRAEVTGSDFEIRRAFAMHLDGHEEARPYRYERRGGGLRVLWRSIRVVAASPRR